MPEQITDREARRRVTQLNTFADGFWDMRLGGLLILFSLYPVTRELLGPALNLLLFVCLLAVLIVGLGYVRRVASVPRIGVVRLARSRLTTLTLITLLLATITLVGATLFMEVAVGRPPLPGAPVWLNSLAGAIFSAALIVALFSVFAYLVSVPRLHLYGWLFGLAVLLSTALERSAGYTFHFPLAIAGLVMLAIGLVLFRSFLRRYPVAGESR